MRPVLLGAGRAPAVQSPITPSPICDAGQGLASRPPPPASPPSRRSARVVDCVHIPHHPVSSIRFRLRRSQAIAAGSDAPRHWSRADFRHSLARRAAALSRLALLLHTRQKSSRIASQDDLAFG